MSEQVLVCALDTHGNNNLECKESSDTLSTRAYDLHLG